MSQILTSLSIKVIAGIMLKHTFLLLILSCVALHIGKCEDKPVLLLGNNENIQFLSVNNPEKIENVIRGLDDSGSCDYLYADNLVFWMETGESGTKKRWGYGKIQSTFTNVSMKNRKKRDIVTKDLLKPEGLACDWVNHKLYWADSETDTIEVSELDGSNRKVIIWNKLDEPRALAVDPSKGVMFWTDWGDNPKIERAGMDGSHRSILMEQDGIFWPNGLTIDYDAEKLYWVDAKHHYIYRMNFDGTGREVVLSSGGNSGNSGTDNLSTLDRHPFAVTISGDMIYWTDWATYSIHSSAKNGTGRTFIIKDKMASLHDIHTYSQQRQKPAPNPCGNGNGGCSHLCLLSPYAPYYSCACPTGIKMKPDNKTCEKEHQKILLLVRRTDLRIISLDTPDLTNFVLPVEGIDHAVAIDFDPVDDYVYWTDYEQLSITRARLNGSDQEVIVSKNLKQADGVALDWIARNLYWTDMERNYIAVSRLNGTSQKYIITTDIDQPRAIVLDPMAGYLYWSDWGNFSKVEQTALDGSQRKVLVSTGVKWPNGLALDYTKRLLYWADAHFDRIECIDLDGNNRRVLLSEGIPHIFGFTLLDDWLYWTDWHRRRVERMKVNDRSSRMLIIDQLPDLMGIKATNITPTPGTNACALNNGGCTHLCLYTPEGATCHCPVGMEILEDMKSCIEPDAFLLYCLDPLDSNEVWSYSLGTAKGITSSLPLPHKMSPSFLDFTVHDSRLYWGDSEEKKIYRSFLNGSNTEAVVDLHFIDLEGMAVDWSSGNIYWSNFPDARIEVMRIKTKSRRTIVWEDLEIARCLTLDPEAGYIYWSEWSQNNGGIKRAEMDGSDTKTLISKKYTERSNSLTIDFEQRRLYWVDIDAGVIRSATLDGDDIRTVITETESEKIYTAALYDSYIYWSNSDTQTIKRANKTNGQDIVIVQSDAQVSDMKVFHSSRQVGKTACTFENGGCQHLCFSLPANDYKCGCPSHYTLNNDNVTCSPPKNFVLFSQLETVNMISYDKSAENSVPSVLSIPSLNEASVIDYDVIHDFVYWLDSNKNTIFKSRQNGTENSTVLSVPPGKDKKIVDFSVDAFNRFMFWVNGEGSIIIQHLDTRMNGTIVKGGSTASIKQSDFYIIARKIALSPRNSELYFTAAYKRESNEKMSIIKASYSGEILDLFFRRHLTNVEDIAVDDRNQRIYYINEGKIEQCGFDGKKQKDTINREIVNPIGLAVGKSVLYFIDKQSQKQGTIEKLDLESGKTKTIIQSGIEDLSSITAITSIKQTELSYYYVCHIDNGGCSHICINNGDGTTSCACPTQLRIVSDNTCEDPPTCGPKHFTCPEVYGKSPPCIPEEWRCDGEEECYNGADEKNCPFCESSNSFMCGSISRNHDDQMSDLGSLLGILSEANTNGIQCVPDTQRCDGNEDCFDGSDELQCRNVCKSDEFPCNDGKLCIDMSRTCDKTIDCLDGSDESVKHCKESYDKDHSTLILIGIGTFFAFVLFLIIVFVFRKCRTNQNQYPSPGTITFTPAADGSVELNVNYRANGGEGIASVNHAGQRGHNLPIKKGGSHRPSTSINLSIGHSSQRINMVNPHNFVPQYNPSSRKYDPINPTYPSENFSLHERPHIPGASSSGSSTKYGSVTKYLPTLNPPPSPATDRSGSKSTGEGAYLSSDQSVRTGSCQCRRSHRHRRHYRHPTTPCTSDTGTCDDYSYHSSASGECRHMGSKSSRPSSPPPPYCPHCCYVCHCPSCHSSHVQAYHGGYPYPPMSYHSHSSHRYHPHDVRGSHGYNSGATSSSSSSQVNPMPSDGSCTRFCYHKGSRHHHHGSKHSARAGSSSHRHPPPYNSDSDPFAPPPTPRSQYYLSDCCNTHDEGDDADEAATSNAAGISEKFINTVEEENEATENSSLLQTDNDLKPEDQNSEMGSEVALTEPTVVDARLSESEAADGEETSLLTSRATSPSLTEQSYRIFNPPPSPATDSS